MTAQLDLLSGAHLRDEGTSRVLANETTEWKARCEAAIAALAKLCATGERETFTAEDVRAIAGDPGHPNAMGAAFLRAQRRRIIRNVGWTRSTRPEAHRCRLAEYAAGEGA